MFGIVKKISISLLLCSLLVTGLSIIVCIQQFKINDIERRLSKDDAINESQLRFDEAVVSKFNK